MYERTGAGIMTRLRPERGAVEVLVALALVAILGITALVVDIGNAKQVRRNFQTAADSGSIAGAQQLATSSATAQKFAGEYAFDSMSQPRPPGMSQISCPAGAPSPGTTICYQSSAGAIVYVTTPYTVSPPPANGTNPPAADQVNVKICQTLSTSFARVLGINTTLVCNSATSVYTPPTGNCVICVMNSNPNDQCAFSVGGNASLTVTGTPPGPITVNSPNPNGVCGGGSTTVNAPGGFTWVGCASTCKPKGTWNPDPVHGAATPDPLANVPVPSVSTAGSCSPSGSGAQTCSPGVYSTLPLINGTTTLSPGVYVIKNTINLQQQKTLLGTGVMIYFACSNYPTPCNPGEDGAGFSGNNGTVGTASQPLSAPTSGTYSGLLIFADRNNAGNLMAGDGNVTYNLKGTIYGLNASITLGGTAGVTLDSRLVIGEISLQGTPNINEVYSDQYQGLITQAGVSLVG